MPMEKMFNFMRLVAGEEALKWILKKGEFWKKKFQMDYPEPWQQFTYRQCTPFLKYYEMNKWLSNSVFFFRATNMTGQRTTIYSERIRHNELEYDNYDLYVDILRSYKWVPQVLDQNGKMGIKSMRLVFNSIPGFNDDKNFIFGVIYPMDRNNKNRSIRNFQTDMTKFLSGLELSDKNVNIIIDLPNSISNLLSFYSENASKIPIKFIPVFESLKNFVALVKGERKPMCYSSLCVNEARLEEFDTCSLFCSEFCQASYHTFITNIVCERLHDVSSQIR
jgi:hypothetical protein